MPGSRRATPLGPVEQAPTAPILTGLPHPRDLELVASRQALGHTRPATLEPSPLRVMGCSKVGRVRVRLFRIPVRCAFNPGRSTVTLAADPSEPGNG
jgi:hypothetical protein